MDPTTIPIATEIDLLICREEARTLAASLGFSPVDQVRIATAVSEIVRNVLTYAVRGAMTMTPSPQGALTIVIEDEGPGIPDLERALQDGFSTGQSLGVGLPGSRRLMDEFRITSQVNKGTRVEMVKRL
jgi:serine/threonine-protein kinase RsbT